MTKKHFHSLEALRFFAFFKVYLLHIPLQGDFPIFSYLKGGGGIGVSFFFVLSGFLITYLLAFEKLSKGKINVKNFMVRRSLRIWPLFYLLVILAYLLPYDFKSLIGFHMNGGGYDLDWRYSFTFLENYRMLFLDNWPKTTPLSVFWSLCIEEHFYIFWVVSFFILPSKHLFKFLISGFLIAWVARYFDPYLFPNETINTNDLFTNIDFFASGGILGFLVAKDYDKVSNFILNINNWMKRLFLLTVVLIVIFQSVVLPYEPGTIFFLFRSSIIAILFTLVIAIFIPMESKLRIKSKVLAYLGTISYGLYVFHIIYIHLLFQLFIHLDIKLDNWFTLSFYMLTTLTASIITSAISYRYFEKKFLLLRDRWRFN